MENKFLEDNELVEQAVEAALADGFTESSVNGLISALQLRMRKVETQWRPELTPNIIGLPLLTRREAEEMEDTWRCQI